MNTYTQRQRKGLPALVRHLSSRDHEVQASAAGALQSVCFQARGRIALRELGAISLVLNILTRARNQGTTRVMARATGLLHNVSSDVSSIPEIRKAGGIDVLTSLLRAPSASTCASAAGALQNLSREPLSKTCVSFALFRFVFLCFALLSFASFAFSRLLS